VACGIYLYPAKGAALWNPTKTSPAGHNEKDQIMNIFITRNIALRIATGGAR